MKHKILLYTLAITQLVMQINLSAKRSDEKHLQLFKPKKQKHALEQPFPEETLVVKSLCSELEHKHAACDKVTAITHVPYVIKKSGKYCLPKDLEYKEHHAAITIEASNVTLNLANHSISITSPKATAILITGSEVTIESDGLYFKHSKTEDNKKALPTSIAIHILNTSKIVLNGIFAQGFTKGVLIENSEDVVIENSRLVACGDGINSNNSNAVLVQYTTLRDNAQGILFDQASKNCLIDHVTETNSLFGSFMRWIDGLTIEHSTFEVTSPMNQFNCMQFGSSIEIDAKAHNVIIRNSEFINRNKILAHDAAAGFDGLLFVAGSNALIENCIIDINAAPMPAGATSLPYVNGALHVSATLPFTGGDPAIEKTRIFKKIRVRNCIISNGLSNAITTDNFTTELTVENCILGSSMTGVNLVGSTACVIKENEIQKNKSNGVTVGASPLAPHNSDSNSIEYNVIANNGGTGVELTDASLNNLVKYNQTFSNTGFGVDNEGTNNKVFYNIAYNNGLGNYSGVPLSITNAPGAIMLVGSNVDA